MLEAEEFFSFFFFKGKKTERINFHIVNKGPRQSNHEIYRPALLLLVDLAYHNGLLMIESTN